MKNNNLLLGIIFILLIGIFWFSIYAYSLEKQIEDYLEKETSCHQKCYCYNKTTLINGVITNVEEVCEKPTIMEENKTVIRK